MQKLVVAGANLQSAPFNCGSNICLETIALRRNQLMEPFFKESKKATEIKTNRQTTDQEIDKMVCALYELTKRLRL